ncbi:MAG TPA: PTS system mannose/fructose/sorbose family transporter subunit IID [Longimicrobiaceae bacterium]|nr:PTS system mannose/fructose/sorbose family transporter subunit IID [Longimicrobiaceae bacterium]
MSRIGAGARRSMLLRSFAVQGAWNYRSFIGTGMAFVLAPALRRVHAGDPAALGAALSRHAELFNSHPYLATVAAGAVARLEDDGTPAETVVRFKNALRGSLGALGDRLVWLVWRPASVLLGVSLVLAGAAWWVALLAFLAVYNALHLWMRVWGLRVGLREGLGVARALREAPFPALGEAGARAGAVLAGLATVLAVGRTAGSAPEWWGVGAAAAALGIALGRRVRPTAAVGLLVVLIAGLLLAPR